MLKAIAVWFGYWFFAALFLLGTIYIGVPAAQSLIFAVKLDSFPTAQGVLSEPKIKTEVTQRNIDEHGPVEKRVHFTPWLVYRFKAADGSTYEAEEMLTAELAGYVKTSEARALEFASQYPEGQSVTVHYNPANPYEATLTTSKTGRFWLFQVGYVLAALIGLAMVIGFLWKGGQSLVSGFRAPSDPA